MQRFVKKIPHASIAAVILAFLAPSSQSSATLIASESFFTSASPVSGEYTNNTNLGVFPNSAVVNGNSGFSSDSANRWMNSTGTLLSDSTVSRTHNGLTGVALDGSIRLRPTAAGGNARNSYRLMPTVPTTSSTYYLSGLVQVDTAFNLDLGETIALGFGTSLAASTSDFSKGFHFGLSEDADGIYLSASAGGSTFDLGDATFGTTYQIVLSLQVNAAGADTLNAWYAPNGATTLTQGLVDQSVETWSSASDLQAFVAQFNAAGNGGNGVYYDEVRFGTSMSDVTLIPEPATTALMFGGLALSGLFLRRRMKRA